MVRGSIDLLGKGNILYRNGKIKWVGGEWDDRGKMGKES